ncbi:hypothetical protein NDU88_007465 [Pleurodeles waltl]|uniref:Uncharacterized protein n=1 Tax=Pleurodeles waltl TaxID=8319 RepID=A0AAV7N5G0_PLEWA|nr:hypothetical protein NDU88_007465 [Pleurodeles waltl]
MKPNQDGVEGAKTRRSVGSRAAAADCRLGTTGNQEWKDAATSFSHSVYRADAQADERTPPSPAASGR